MCLQVKYNDFISYLWADGRGLPVVRLLELLKRVLPERCLLPGSAEDAKEEARAHVSPVTSE